VRFLRAEVVDWGAVMLKRKQVCRPCFGQGWRVVGWLEARSSRRLLCSTLTMTRRVTFGGLTI
jgi:hypothetical protein